MIVTKSKRNKWQETERKKHIVDQALLFLYTMTLRLRIFHHISLYLRETKVFLTFVFFVPHKEKLIKKHLIVSINNVLLSSRCIFRKKFTMKYL